MAANRVVAKPGWSVKVAKFDHSGEEPFPEGAHVTLDEEQPGRVTIVSTAPAGVERRFRCVDEEDHLRWHGAGLTLLVRRMWRSKERTFLCGVWLRRDGRGDTPVGSWTAEEDTVDDEG